MIIFAYADDFNILGGSVHTVQVNAEALVVATKEIGLEVNADKTKYMIMSRDQNAGRGHSVKIDNSSINPFSGGFMIACRAYQGRFFSSCRHLNFKIPSIGRFSAMPGTVPSLSVLPTRFYPEVFLSVLCSALISLTHETFPGPLHSCSSCSYVIFTHLNCYKYSAFMTKAYVI